MRRVFVIAASSLALAACSGSMPSLDLPSFQSTPAASTLEFESEPPGAEVKTSTGQTCRTPCAISVAANDLTATFTLNGYQSASVPVKMTQSVERSDPDISAQSVPRFTPNPVYVELTLAAPVRRPPPPVASKPPTKKKPKTAAKPNPPIASDPMSPPSAEQPPPSSAWPAPNTAPR